MKPDETGISSIHSPQAFSYRSNHQPQKIGQQDPMRPEASSEGHTSSAVTSPSAERILYNKIQGANAAAHAVVQEIRAVDETMQQIGRSLDGMKHAVDTILKNYPPFPVGSNERIAQLRQFSALRKIIDQLTFPPKEENSPAVILGDRQDDPAGTDWGYTPTQGSQQLVVRRQPLHTGRQGLDIPDLPIDASDDDLAGAMERLATASKTLQSRREQFVTDANRVISSMI